MRKLYDINPFAFEYYRNNVKGNENIDYETAQKKLTVDVLCGKDFGVKNGKQLVYYGNLAILIKENEIVWMRNYKDNKKKYHTFINKDLRDRLRKEYGLVKEVKTVKVNESLLHKIQKFFHINKSLVNEI